MRRKNAAHSIAVIGGGALGGAIARGLRRTESAELWVCDRHADKLRQLKSQGIDHTCERGEELPAALDLAILAVKPKATVAAAASLRPVRPKAVLSVASGITLASLASGFPDESRLFRAMMNTAVEAGEGLVAICHGNRVQTSLANRVKNLLAPLGAWLALDDEEQMPAVTALMACAPAFFLLALEGLSDGGVRLGLKRPLAEELAIAAAQAAAAVARRGPMSLGRQAICSPGGSTIEGILVMERLAVRAAFADAAQASAARAKAQGG